MRTTDSSTRDIVEVPSHKAGSAGVPKSDQTYTFSSAVRAGIAAMVKHHTEEPSCTARSSTTTSTKRAALR
jgi:hypothetical protein